MQHIPYATYKPTSWFISNAKYRQGIAYVFTENGITPSRHYTTASSAIRAARRVGVHSVTHVLCNTLPGAAPLPPTFGGKP